MARAKTEKKTVSFVKADLINRLIKDRAELENRSESAIMEEIILNTMLPKNKEARNLVESSLYGDRGDVRTTLITLFENNAAGINFEAVHDNLLAIVRFASNQQQYCSTVLTGKEQEIPHLVSQMKILINELENLEKKDEEYQGKTDYGKYLLNELEREPVYSRLVNFYQLILNNWEAFKNLSITYRLLSDLVKLVKNWRNDSEVRVELLELINNVSSEWSEG